ncbi:MAG: rod shape-determining protein MreD [Candidatus Paceibacterota bacterium]
MIRKNINNYVFVIGVIAFLFLQMTFIPQMFRQNMVPNLVLIALIAGSLLASDGSVLYAAFFAGYIFDIYSGKYFGAVMMSFVIAVFSVSYMNHYFLKEAFSLSVLFSAILSVILYHVSYYSVTYVLNSYTPAVEAGSLAMIAASDILLLAVMLYLLIYIFSYNRNEK